MSVEMVTEADELEARCRKAMSVLPKARGWDTQWVRDDELAWIDALLDAWNETTSGAQGLR